MHPPHHDKVGLIERPRRRLPQGGGLILQAPSSDATATMLLDQRSDP